MSSNQTSVTVSNDQLGKLYDDGWNDKGGDAAKFDSQDSEYRVYKAKTALTTDNRIRFELEQDHIRGGATDDHVVARAYFLQDGTFSEARMSWEAGNDGYQAPDWAIDLVADVAEVGVDAVVDVLSEGALVELDPELAELTGKVVRAVGDAFNFFSKEIVKLSDDGGRLNFIAVANHNFNKLLYSVRTPKSAAMSSHVVFSEQSFESAIGHHFNDKDNQAMEYESNGSNYRTWRFDKSVCPGGAGLYASTKIDHIRGENKDDHIVLMISYNAGGRIIQGQAGLQMKNEDPIITPVILQNDRFSIDMAAAIADAVKSRLKSDYGVDGSNSGRQNIPHVIEKTVNAMAKSVSIRTS
jgi:hypothetical protein